MVYYALVSLVPLILLVLSVLGLLLRFSESAAEVERQVLLQIQTQFGDELQASIEGLLKGLQQESLGGTAVSIAGLLVTASLLFRHLRMSFRAVWNRDPPLIAGRVRAVVLATLIERVMSFLMVLGGGAVLLAAVAVIAVSQWINLAVGGLPLLGPTAEWLLPPLTSLMLAAITFATLLKLLPPVRIRWRDVLPGVVVCVLGWAIVTEALSLYGLYFGSSPSTAGALGALLAFMLWMNVVCQLLFFAAEVCKVAADRTP